MLKLHWLPAYLIISVALLLGAPFFLVFGHLSDRIGRKKIMLWGCLLAALTYVPIYMGMKAVTPALAAGAKAVMLSAIPFPNLVALIGLVFLQIIYVTMVYGPIAAFLVELFPTNIRYTSMSLPYHLGNGWFGGFLPLIATALTASAVAKEAFGANAIYAGLLYPIAIALVTVVVGAIFIKETRDHQIDTAIRKDTGVQEIFDWVAVLAALAIGFVLLLQWNSDFLPDLAAAKGLFAALWNNLWYPAGRRHGPVGPADAVLPAGVRPAAGPGHGPGLPGPHRACSPSSSTRPWWPWAAPGSSSPSPSSWASTPRCWRRATPSAAGGCSSSRRPEARQEESPPRRRPGPSHRIGSSLSWEKRLWAPTTRADVGPEALFPGQRT